MDEYDISFTQTRIVRIKAESRYDAANKAAVMTDEEIEAGLLDGQSWEVWDVTEAIVRRGETTCR